MQSTWMGLIQSYEPFNSDLYVIDGTSKKFETWESFDGIFAGLKIEGAMCQRCGWPLGTKATPG